MIELYKHNGAAYRAAVALLSETRRAAVVHPTGTGKSYIAFKLAEENEKSSFCWLSPSEYIYKTQRENLTAQGYAVPKNITFMTYAKAAKTSEEEIRKIKAEYIVLDEFHRCGASVWGLGVRRLLDTHKDSCVLGLTATNIRYLDGRRDMADELFDGHVASHMTLGEAMARGILPLPRYVTSLYEPEEKIKTYDKRINAMKNASAKSDAREKLDALRRFLERSAGLEKLFAKHITEHSGKYIIFCPSVDRLIKISKAAPKWFSETGASPRIYEAYAEDKESAASFAAFKNDESDRLKLLLCVDMLNEGIHIDGVSGVILFRPTASPIIYKQQIGRALSAGKSGAKGTKEKRTPVIIDIVNNIESLCSVNALKDEMRAYAEYCRAMGLENETENETFEITDETRDAKRLIEKLEESLTASWDAMYALAKEYYERRGNLDVPKRYKTDGGYSLGSWLYTQRLIYKGGALFEERAAKLESIGMKWESPRDAKWAQYYKALCLYRYENGNANVKPDFVTKDGVRLGAWLANIKHAKSLGKRSAFLTDERIEALNKLGVEWEKHDANWERNYAECVKWYETHGNLEIPSAYVNEKGERVGAWLARTRKARSGRLRGASPLTEEKIKRLDAIGMEWTDKYTRRWENGYEEAKKYKEERGDLKAPRDFVTKSGFPLGRWLSNHLGSDESGKRSAIKVTSERKRKLEELGFDFSPRRRWRERVELCRKYFAEHGDIAIPQHYVTTDGVWLGKWLYECKRIYGGEIKDKSLTARQIQDLEALGMDWRKRTVKRKKEAATPPRDRV